MLGTVDIYVLDELVEDTSTVHTGAEIVKTNSLVSKSKTENIGDAWFKKISEIERKTFTCHICDQCSKSFNTVKKFNRHKKSHNMKCTQESQKLKKNSVTKRICKPRKRQRKKL